MCSADNKGVELVVLTKIKRSVLNPRRGDLHGRHDRDRLSDVCKHGFASLLCQSSADLQTSSIHTSDRTPWIQLSLCFCNVQRTIDEKRLILQKILRILSVPIPVFLLLFVCHHSSWQPRYPSPSFLTRLSLASSHGTRVSKRLRIPMPVFQTLLPFS